MDQTEWGRKGRFLNVFVSSPTDVLNERRLVSLVIEEINRTIGQRFRITLQVRMWERLRPTGENPMQFIKRQLYNCDLFVMIFSRRFGSSVLQGGEYRSGTQEEYETAQALREESQDKRPEIFTYFKKITDEATLSDPGPELSKVLQFRDKIKNTIFFKEYSSVETFAPMFKDNIIEWMLEIFDRIGTDKITEQKRTVLQRFFALGSSKDSRPSVRIIYPPIPWVEKWADVTHLLPYMVIEDFQAIHKFTKDLNIAGCDDVKAKTTEVFDEHHERFANKIFICLPRNLCAQRHLEKIPESRFGFKIEHSAGNDKETKYIVWKRKANDNPLCVYSPQSKYLLIQRKKGRSD